MELSKDDWIQWKNLPCYTRFVEDMAEIAADVAGYLVQNAGKDSLEDRRMAGVIQGLKWLVEWQPEFIDEGDEQDAESQGTPAAY